MKLQDNDVSLWRPNREKLLSKLFHDLNQPLTSLGCCLELALLASHNEEQTKNVLQEASTRVEQISHLTGCLHRLIEADDPQDEPISVDFDGVVLQVVEELTPIAKTLQMELSLSGKSGLQLRCDHNRLRQALFYLLDTVLFFARQAVRLHLTPEGDQGAMLELTSLLKDVAADETTERDNLDRSVGLAAAYRTFELVGAEIAVVQQRNHLAISIHLAENTARIKSEMPSSAKISHSRLLS
jgi:hypothetical protein